jgi:hypothetical protein
MLSSERSVCVTFRPKLLKQQMDEMKLWTEVINIACGNCVLWSGRHLLPSYQEPRLVKKSFGKYISASTVPERLSEFLNRVSFKCHSERIDLLLKVSGTHISKVCSLPCIVSLVQILNLCTLDNRLWRHSRLNFVLLWIVPVVVWPSSGTLVSNGETRMSDTLSVSHYISKIYKNFSEGGCFLSVRTQILPVQNVDRCWITTFR